MTRETDRFLSLQARANYSNDNGARIFVSIHLNAFNGQARGTETFLHTNSTASETLATRINRSIIDAFGLPDRGVKRANFSVLRGTYRQALSVLTEAAFIDNADDAAIIKRDDFIKKTARAHADAILSVANDGDTVCLDPGHGGHDSGATGHGMREKDLVLQIALKTREILLGNTQQSSSTGAMVIYNNAEVSAFIEDGRTYAQMRELADLVSVPVDWDQQSKQAFLGGEPVSGKLIDGRTYLPVRELAEMIGLRIVWDQESKTVTLKD